MKDQSIPEWVYNKMKQYCAYQERCMHDVTQKLEEFHLQEHLVEKIIIALRNDNFLNEERYAKMFASGKLRINKWGKNKIYAALQHKNVPELFILEGLNDIDDKEYLKILKGVILSKSKELKESDFERRNKKLAKFAIARGFESDLVWKVLEYRD